MDDHFIQPPAFGDSIETTQSVERYLCGPGFPFCSTFKITFVFYSFHNQITFFSLKVSQQCVFIILSFVSIEISCSIRCNESGVVKDIKIYLVKFSSMMVNAVIFCSYIKKTCYFEDYPQVFFSHKAIMFLLLSSTLWFCLTGLCGKSSYITVYHWRAEGTVLLS